MAACSHVSSVMSGLSQEQLERIRENKRKAQERLARKRPAPQSTPELPPVKQPAIKPNGLSFYSSSTTSKPATTNKPTITSKPTNKRPDTTLILKKQITAAFVLRDKDRFKVLVPYDSQLIELFKGISSKSYGVFLYVYMCCILLCVLTDASTQVWSFALQDYQKLSG